VLNEPIKAKVNLYITKSQ